MTDELEDDYDDEDFEDEEAIGYCVYCQGYYKIADSDSTKPYTFCSENCEHLWKVTGRE